MNNKGMKFDDGKPQWNLVIKKLLEGLVRVLEFGAKKYAPHSWQTVPNAKTRYFDAIERHLGALQNEDGSINLNAVDAESGLPHTGHILANAYFLEGLRVIENQKNMQVNQ